MDMMFEHRYLSCLHQPVQAEIRNKQAPGTMTTCTHDGLMNLVPSAASYFSTLRRCQHFGCFVCMRDEGAPGQNLKAKLKKTQLGPLVLHQADEVEPSPKIKVEFILLLFLHLSLKPVLSFLQHPHIFTSGRIPHNQTVAA